MDYFKQLLFGRFQFDYVYSHIVKLGQNLNPQLKTDVFYCQTTALTRLNWTKRNSKKLGLGLVTWNPPPNNPTTNFSATSSYDMKLKFCTDTQ